MPTRLRMPLAWELSSMATQGVTTINFGSTGTDRLVTTVTGQAWVTATTDIEAYFMASDTTADNDEEAHSLAAAVMGLSIGNRVDGVGFDIIAVCEDAIACGTFKARWVGN